MKLSDIFHRTLLIIALLLDPGCAALPPLPPNPPDLEAIAPSRSSEQNTLVSMTAIIDAPFWSQSRTWSSPLPKLIIIEPATTTDVRSNSSSRLSPPILIIPTPSSAPATTPTHGNDPDVIPVDMKHVGPIAGLWIVVSLSIAVFLGWLGWEVYGDIEEMIWRRRVLADRSLLHGSHWEDEQ
ncbi:hypothetical protein EK21DRAFT_112578 [Setomelanomma holmii]|uniref:Uncharacterized protein n=1 Tax=Setomelanomma holmii TaxID=210430 RepID=A0A9P4H7T6_9PLEO|nr:hypothetical protein EK21DRAFT_112578 [Setomelanomma holmii]